jgi:hypothetical protein
MQKRFLFILIALAIFIPAIAFADTYNENALNCSNLPPLCPEGQAATIIGQTDAVPPACIWECNPINPTSCPEGQKLGCASCAEGSAYCPCECISDSDMNAQTNPTLILSTPDSNTCQWCAAGGNCYELDYRLNGQYCSVNKIFENQKGIDAECENNSECKSNMCSYSKCIETGLIATIINFFKNFLASIFGTNTPDDSTNTTDLDINYEEQNFQTTPPTCDVCAEEGSKYLCTFMDGYKICSDSTEASTTCVKCDTN